MSVRIAPTYKALFLLLTNKCNLICKHCCVWSEPKGHWGISLKQALGIIDQAHDVIGQHRFILSGGEPLVRFNDTISILKYSLAKDSNTLLLTNGMLITKRVAERLSSLTGLRIRISLDGASQESHDLMRGKGTFERTLLGIDNLVEAGFNLQKLELGCTIVPGREYEMEDILDFALAKGIGIVKLKAISKLGRAIENWTNVPLYDSDSDTQKYRNILANGFFEKQSKGWLFEDIDDASFKELNIYYDGSVYAYSFIGDKDQENAYLGNILDTPLKVILSSPKVSKAISNKFLQFSIGPKRSLRSINAKRRHSY